MTTMELLKHYRTQERQKIHENTVDWDHQVPAKGAEDIVRRAWERLDTLERLMDRMAVEELRESGDSLRTPRGANLRLAVEEPE